jgi:hypothetical protein
LQQDQPTQEPLFSAQPVSGPVECLGLSFAHDAGRRAYFPDKLRAHLADPAFRQIEGFPLGSDEDILRLLAGARG